MISLDTLESALRVSSVVMAIFFVGGLAVAAMIAAGVWMFVRRRRRRPREVLPELSINLAEMADHGPPDARPALRFYNVPVRLAVLVLAPVGRGGEPPKPDQLGDLIDQIVPGLGRVAILHAAAVKIWPAQLSSQGFASRFFAHVRLPGERGKGTPWCSLVGRIEAAGRGYLAGLALCAAAPNSLGQYVVEREPQWHDMLRIGE